MARGIVLLPAAAEGRHQKSFRWFAIAGMVVLTIILVLGLRHPGATPSPTTEESAEVEPTQPVTDPVVTPSADDPSPAVQPNWVCHYSSGDPNTEGTLGPPPAGWEAGAGQLLVGSDWYLFTVLKGVTRDVALFGFLQMKTGKVVVIETLPTIRWEGPAPWKIGDKPTCGGRFVAPEGGD